eukprot:GHVU01230040.1.p3 GENE.GHVU01230040.1~~GHVU01230040.1.p3  ORF type:complete len:103 (-),score=4.17 GHVU01230040.1:86-394(-)
MMRPERYIPLRILSYPRLTHPTHQKEDITTKWCDVQRCACVWAWGDMAAGCGAVTGPQPASRRQYPCPYVRGQGTKDAVLTRQPRGRPSIGPHGRTTGCLPL